MFRWITSAIALVLLISGCAHNVTFDPIRAKVVDAVSGEPLEGVRVVYKVTAYAGSYTGHGGKRVNLLIREGITDKDGVVALPGGEVNAEPFRLNTHYDYPKIIFFKREYLPAFEGNPWVGMPELHNITSWQDNGKVVRLGKPTDPRDYVDKLAIMTIAIEGIYSYGISPDECAWKKIPETLLYLDSEYHRLHQLPGNEYGLVNLPTIDQFHQPYWESRCGSALNFFDTFKMHP